MLPVGRAESQSDPDAHFYWDTLYLLKTLKLKLWKIKKQASELWNASVPNSIHRDLDNYTVIIFSTAQIIVLKKTHFLNISGEMKLLFAELRKIKKLEKINDFCPKNIKKESKIGNFKQCHRASLKKYSWVFEAV